jgi:hypothetical protein
VDTITVCEADKLEVGCDACGVGGTLTRETGDVIARLTDFADQHLLPRVIRAHFITPLGAEIGWYDWTCPVG